MATLLQSKFKNNVIKTSASIVFFVLLASANAFAQQKITTKDAKEIALQATTVVRNIPNLLNFIADPNNTPSDLIETVGDSYKPSRNRIFYNKDIIVEDDIDPAATLGNSKDVEVSKYLTNLDVQYEKSTDASISYNNVVTSGIKKKDYIYVNVKFDSEFKLKNKLKKSGYNPKQRLATVRMTYNNNRWEALVVSMAFYDPAKPIDGKENNVDLYSDTSATATMVSQEDFAKEKDSYIQSKEEEEKNKQAIYDEYITLATTYVNNKQYKEALELYEKAKALKSFVPALDKKILDAKKLAAEYTYENFKNKGDKAKNERRYPLAIQHYQQALALKPDASAVINAEIAPLNKQLAIVNAPNNKVASGLYEQAIEDCKKLLNDNKKNKNDFPELYYIMGKAYEGLAAKTPGETKNIERAAENYNLAIQYFPNYLDARITRADFAIKYKNDYPSAISDYDMLVINALDNSPEKPQYMVTRAKFKDKTANYAAALDDYTSAILLNKEVPSFYYDKGELLYRTSKFDEAQKNFDIALKLDPKYGKAYYYRGLNYVALNNITAAGLDFTEVEKIGFELPQLRKVDSISNAFFLSGEDMLHKHDFVNADSAYNNALKIRKCNNLALHGKAEIRFITAAEMGPKAAGAKAKYLESIDLNNQSIICNADFSDAHYKHGLAHYRIANYDQAIKSFGEAIRSEAVNSNAYIQRGNAYQTTEKFQKAAEDYQQAILIEKQNLEVAKKTSKDEQAKALVLELSNTQQLLGEALYYAKDYVNSLIALDVALNYNEFNSEALYYRGLVRVQQAEYSKAFKDYYAAIKVSPKYKYYYANANASYTNKNYEQAIANFSDAIKTDTLSAVKNRYYLRGMSYFRNKMMADAVKDFELYEKDGVVSSDTSFYSDFGLAKLYADQDTSAISYLNKAVNVRSNDSRALYSLGCAYAKGGQYDKALEYFEKAFALKQLSKDDIKLPENTFLVSLNKQKPMKTKYNALKKQYMDN